MIKLLTKVADLDPAFGEKLATEITKVSTCATRKRGAPLTRFFSTRLFSGKRMRTTMIA